MAEMADAGKDHRDVAFVGGGDDFFVADRAAGLDGGGGTGFGGGQQAGQRRRDVEGAQPQRRQQARVGEGEGVGDDGDAVDQQDGRLGAGIGQALGDVGGNAREVEPAAG